MSLDQNDLNQVQDLISKGVAAGITAISKVPTMGRTSAEIGSPEFAEDRTQINSLNNKWIFESSIADFWRARQRSDDHYADLQSRGLDSLTESVNLSKRVNEAFFTAIEDGRRIRDGWNYNTAYDLANPVAVGAGANVTAGAVPQNRAIDTATAQSALNNTTLQTAIEAAVANAINGTVPTLEAAIGAAVAAALVNVPSTPKAMA